MSSIHVLYILFGIGILVRFYLRRVYDYWKSRNVPTPDFCYFVGNLGPSLELRKSLGELYKEIYDNYDGYNYVGFYKFLKPCLIIRNPELVHDILAKNFDSFQDNDISVDAGDFIFGKNLCALKGKKWKLARQEISPHFTTDKVESLMPFVVENAKQLIGHLETRKSGFVLDIKDLAMQFTCDNVSSCVFGLDGCCLGDSDDEFLKQANNLIKPSMGNGFKLLLRQMFPFLTSILKVKFASSETINYFKNIVTKTIEYRRENRVKRNDFLDFITANLPGKFDDITAACASFLFDGFETNSVVISFALYEIASNAEIQEKLRKEIDDVVERNNDEFTYKALGDMDFLDCVLKESLRKNPPVLAITRTCTKPYKLPPLLENTPGPKLLIKPGTPVIIPIEALHADERVFPDPTEFVPNRFSRKIKGTIKRGAYIPFGDGGRVCLGRNFGIMQTKVAIAALVSNYDISVDDKTQEPLVLDPQRFLRSAAGGILLRFTRRK